MSMAAKSSDSGDKTSEANLQVDGQVEKPAQGAADWQEMEEEDGSPPHSPDMVPCPEAAVRLPQHQTLLRNMSDFNR